MLEWKHLCRLNISCRLHPSNRHTFQVDWKFSEHRVNCFPYHMQCNIITNIIINIIISNIFISSKANVFQLLHLWEQSSSVDFVFFFYRKYFAGFVQTANMLDYYCSAHLRCDFRKEFGQKRAIITQLNWIWMHSWKLFLRLCPMVCGMRMTDSIDSFIYRWQFIQTTK